MKIKTGILDIEFTKPNVIINCELKETELVSLLKCEKSESHKYTFEAKLFPSNIIVFNIITFNESGFRLEMIISETAVEQLESSKNIYINDNKTNILKDYLYGKFGSPRLRSKLHSILIKPFYIHRWTLENLNITHKYQDSVGGFYESLMIDVSY